MDHQNKSLNFIFPTKHVIPESLKFSHWLSEFKRAMFFLLPNFQGEDSQDFQPTEAKQRQNPPASLLAK